MDGRIQTVEGIVSQILQNPSLRCIIENVVREATHSEGNSTVSLVPQLVRTLPSTPTSIHTPTRTTSTRDELRHLFPTIRSDSPANQQNSTITPRRTTVTRRARTRKNSPAETNFNRDVILLKSSRTLLTLKGVQKSTAYEEGFAFSNVKFNSRWNHDQIKQAVKELFLPRLGEIEFEIMVPMSGRLVKPNLPPGIDLDGNAMKSIFYHKIVYIRPLVQLPGICNIDSDSDESESIHEDSLTNIPVDASEGLRTANIDLHGETNEAALLEPENLFLDETEVTLKNLLQSLNEQITDEGVTIFNIYREDIFGCCVRALGRSSFSPLKKISVKFSDIEGTAEGAVDAGGPTREMFRLVLNNIKDSRMFFGLDKKYIRLDMDALNKNHYYTAGQLIALSLIHGGNGPHFFSDSFYSILHQDISVEFPTLSDIEDEHIRNKLQELKSASDLSAIQEILEQNQFFSIAGCEIVKNMDHRDQILEDVKNFYAYHRIRPALEQLREGLKTGMIFELLKSHPTLFKEIMCNSSAVTADTFETLFTIDFSEPDSSKRSIENRTISYWRDFILDCEEGNATDISLKDVIIFITCVETVPPLGFSSTPKITFMHDTNLYPKANTCALEIALPTLHASYESFKYHIGFGIGNCKDFAFA